MNTILRNQSEINAIASYLFFIWDTDEDCNRQLTNEEINEYRLNAERFLNGAIDIFVNLEYIEHDEFEIQSYLYEVGKRAFGSSKNELNLWFKCLYTIFFGYANGPRIGTFVHIYGQEEFIDRLMQRVNDPFRLSKI